MKRDREKPWWNLKIERLPVEPHLEGCAERYCVVNRGHPMGFEFTLDQLASPIKGVYLTCEDLGIRKLRLDGEDLREPTLFNRALEVLRYEAHIQIKRLERIIDADPGDHGTR